jgi:hypothetical protein
MLNISRILIISHILIIIVNVISLLVNVIFTLKKVDSRSKLNVFWWNQLTVRTLVLNARFGAWSERNVIISVRGLPSRSGDYLIFCSFLHHFFNFKAFYKFQRGKDPPRENMRQLQELYNRILGMHVVTAGRML